MNFNRDRVAQLRHVLLIYAGALVCGAVGNLINLPLPWCCQTNSNSSQLGQ